MNQRDQEAALLSERVNVQGSSLDPSDNRWAGWLPEVEAMERKFPQYDLSRGSIMFIGSSSIKLWNSLAEDFPGSPVINHGFGGSHIVDSAYFADRIVLPLAPYTVVMYAGSNDISAGKVPKQLLADYKAFVNRVHSGLPKTKIYFISIASCQSRWEQRDRVMEANRLIKAYSETDERLGFIDVYPYMLGPNGTPQSDLFLDDRLHMNAKGYALWTSIVRPYLGL